MCTYDLEKDAQKGKPVGTVTAVDQNLEDQLDIPDREELEEVTWGEVARGCFCHTPMGWAKIFLTLFWVVFFLYFFILGLEILGDGAQVLTGCAAGALFGDDNNPVSGLMIGILVTCLLQSSSTTTSIVVTLVGAEAVSVEAGIYMIMGANIGTSVTNTIVAMGQLGDGDELERAFAGATVHDMFNFLTVSIFFPLEIISGMFFYLTRAIVKNVDTSSGSDRDGFVKRYIEPVGKYLIDVNKDVTKTVAQGGSCASFYPTSCEDPANPTGETCSVGLVDCSDDFCPVLFQSGATQVADQTAGAVAFLTGLTILFICLAGLVHTLHGLMKRGSTRIIYKATDINGYLAILIGCGITLLVQSSSITTSTLTPFVGLDLIRLEQMYPVTLGANLGTTLTGLLAALVDEGKDSLQVALAHLFFNVFGIIIWYPIPFMRRIPLHMATQLGKATRAWKGFPIVYILVAFFGIPGALLGISTMFTTKRPAQEAIASVLVVLIFAFIVWFIWYWRCKDGKASVTAFFNSRLRQMNALETLPYDMVWAERRIKEIQETTDSAPADVPSIAAEGKKNVYADAADEMEYVMTNVNALVEHLNLEKEVDKQNLGRFYHKVHEPMPEANTSGLRKYRITFGVILATCLGLMAWAIAHLFLVGSTAARGMGGYLTIMTGLFLTYLVAMFFFYDGRNKSMTAYRDKQLKKAAKETYIKDMAQMTADVKKLLEITGLPENDCGKPKNEESASSEDEEMDP